MEKPPIQFQLTNEDDPNNIADLNVTARRVLSEVQNCRELFDELCEEGFVFDHDENNFGTMVLNPAGLRIGTYLSLFTDMPLGQIAADWRQRAEDFIRSPRGHLRFKHATLESIITAVREEMTLRLDVQAAEAAIASEAADLLLGHVPPIVGNERVLKEQERGNADVHALLCHCLRHLVINKEYSFYRLMRMTH